MTKMPRNDIIVPPDNYSVVDVQMMKLRSIPAKMEAEELIRRKFAEVEMTGIFAGDLSPELKAEEQAQEEFWREWEGD